MTLNVLVRISIENSNDIVVMVCEWYCCKDVNALVLDLIVRGLTKISISNTFAYWKNTKVSNIKSRLGQVKNSNAKGSIANYSAHNKLGSHVMAQVLNNKKFSPLSKSQPQSELDFYIKKPPDCMYSLGNLGGRWPPFFAFWNPLVPPTSTMCDFHNYGLIFIGQCTVCLKG